MRFFRRRGFRESDLDEEIRADLELETKRRIEEGEVAEDAERSARRDFGSVALVKEVTRSMWGSASLASLRQDGKYALRLWRNPRGSPRSPC